MSSLFKNDEEKLKLIQALLHDLPPDIDAKWVDHDVLIFNKKDTNETILKINYSHNAPAQETDVNKLVSIAKSSLKRYLNQQE